MASPYTDCTTLSPQVATHVKSYSHNYNKTEISLTTNTSNIIAEVPVLIWKPSGTHMHRTLFMCV
jgi:hypothetical protein